MNLTTAEVNGKKIAFHEDTEFLVQVGRGKGAYKTKHILKGNLAHALMWYNAIIFVNSGYKKRLLMPACSKNPVIVRQLT